MLQVIDAIYSQGAFKPLGDVHLPEQQRVKIVFIPDDGAAPTDDLPAIGLAILTEHSPAFAFLADPREDIYSIRDGEPVL
jgi:hypothetical protein